MQTDTIIALATPPGRGGVAVIRLSGTHALSIVMQLTQFKKIKPGQVYIRSFYTQEGELLDIGIILYFKAPHSFTGEDVVELQGHGSPVVIDRLLHVCVAYGARLARPGEFSERAFLNDKMDLTQAEAIVDLIEASSYTAARLAMRSLQGDFSKKINLFNEQLIALRLYVEAAIDFPEEEIDFLKNGHVMEKLNTLIECLDAILASAAQGMLIKEGATVVIAGHPNAGKSTLMNILAGYDVAIVTPVAGTTRDLMREHIVLDDMPLHLIDTAGLRESNDLIEQEGIKRAWSAIKHADCVLMVIDVMDNKVTRDILDQSIQEALPAHTPIIYVINKIDTLSQPSQRSGQTVYLSAKHGDGLPLLKTMIKEVMGYQPTEGLFLARQRHIDALHVARTYLHAGQEQLHRYCASELLADDLRRAHQSLCEITGEFTSDDLLGKIFSSFCIGK